MTTHKTQSGYPTAPRPTLLAALRHGVDAAATHRALCRWHNCLVQCTDNSPLWVGAADYLAAHTTIPSRRLPADSTLFALVTTLTFGEW